MGDSSLESQVELTDLNMASRFLFSLHSIKPVHTIRYPLSTYQILNKKESFLQQLRKERRAETTSERWKNAKNLRLRQITERQELEQREANRNPNVKAALMRKERNKRLQLCAFVISMGVMLVAVYTMNQFE